jgi:hypothetical protein
MCIIATVVKEMFSVSVKVVKFSLPTFLLNYMDKI